VGPTPGPGQSTPVAPALMPRLSVEALRACVVMGGAANKPLLKREGAPGNGPDGSGRCFLPLQVRPRKLAARVREGGGWWRCCGSEARGHSAGHAICLSHPASAGTS
jgi:hypothetical protein